MRTRRKSSRYPCPDSLMWWLGRGDGGNGGWLEEKWRWVKTDCTTLMNVHLSAVLMFARGTGFLLAAKCGSASNFVCLFDGFWHTAHAHIYSPWLADVGEMESVETRHSIQSDTNWLRSFLFVGQTLDCPLERSAENTLSSQVPKYVHEKHYVPVPEPSPPTYHNVPVPVPVKEPGKAGAQQLACDG